MVTRRIIFGGAIPVGFVYRSALIAMAHSRDGVAEMLCGPFREQREHRDHYRVHKRGTGVKVRAIKGHPFGLDLGLADREALIAFLKTL